MRIRNAFLANHAETREGLAFVSGGFPESYTVFALPLNASLAAVWVVELDETEIGRSFLLDLRVSDPRGVTRPVAHLGVGRSQDTPTVHGAPLYVIVTYRFLVELQVVGLHTFEVVCDGQVMATMPLFVNVLERGGEEQAGASDSPGR